MESVTVAFSADSTSLSVLAAGSSVVPDSGLPSVSAPILHLSSSWKKGKISFMFSIPAIGDSTVLSEVWGQFPLCVI